MAIVNEDGELPVGDDTTPANELLVKKPAIRDPYYNRTVLNDGRDRDVINTLKGFLAGTPINTTWYHQLTSEGGTRTLTNAPSLMSDSVNVSFLQIVNMEVKLPGGVSYNFDPETIDSEVVSTCLTYPGFTPKIGDLFLYQISPGKLGLMKVSDNPQRLSTHNNTAYSVPFTLFAMLTQELKTALDARVRQTMHFNKQRFLDGDGALMSEQEVLDMSYLDTQLVKLEQLYHMRYYDQALQTFLVPDSALFDPYVVKFYQETCGCYSLGKYINLPSHPELLKHWQLSLYASLLGENPTSEIVGTCNIVTASYGRWSSLITLLHNRQLVVLDPNGDTPYISPTVFSLQHDVQDTFDKLVMLKVSHNTLSVPMLRDLLTTVNSLTLEEGFYQIPILIYLTKLARRSLLDGDILNLVHKPVDPYLHIPFTNADLNDSLVTLDVPAPHILAVLDNENMVINMGDGLIGYPDALHVTLDMTAILETLELTEIPGTWYAVAKNHLS
jgi:hypothetical protein